MRPVFRAALSDLIEEIRSVGAEPVFVIAPTLSHAENFTEIPGGVTVFALNDPARFPELFNPDKRNDSGHLNEKGAVDFTRILAEKFRVWREARR